VAQKLAATDPDRAARLLSEAIRAAHSIAGASFRAETLALVAQAVAITDPDRADRLLQDVERIAALVPNHQKVPVLVGMVQAVTATDPNRGAELLVEAVRALPAVTHKNAEADARTRVDIAKAFLKLQSS
jgi:hypothetical protein